MKKKLLSMVLCLCMALTLLPTAALAENTTAVIVGGVTLTDGQYLANGGSGVANELPSDSGYAYFKDGILTLNNAVIAPTSAAADGSNYAIYAGGDLTISLTGSNAVLAGESGNSSGNGSYGVYVGGNLTFQGGGALTTVGGSGATFWNPAAGAAPTGISCGIYASGSFSITGSETKVVAVGGRAETTSYGVCANIISNSGLLVAKGGEVNPYSNTAATYVSQAISTAPSVTASSGAWNQKYAVYGGEDYYVSGIGVTGVTSSVPGHIEWGSDALTLTNTIVIAPDYEYDASTPTALQMPYDGADTITLSGFNVLLAGNGDMYANALRTTKSLTAGGDGALVAVGGYGYSAISVHDNLLLTGGSITAVSGSGGFNESDPACGIKVDGKTGVTGGSGVAVGSSKAFSTSYYNTDPTPRGAKLVSGSWTGKTAEWTADPNAGPLTCAVTYDGNGTGVVNVPVDGNRYDFDDTVTVLEPGKMERPGYTFLHWSTKKEGGYPEYKAGKTFSIGEDTTFYAQWSILTKVKVGGVELTSSGPGVSVYAKTDGSGNVTTDGANESDYNIKFDGGVLTLKSATIKAPAETSGIWSENGDLTIMLEGTNSVTSGDKSNGDSWGIYTGSAFFNRGKLTIKGNGSLDITAGSSNGCSYGIRCVGIDISGNVTVNAAAGSAVGGPQNCYSAGIYDDAFYGDCRISGGATLTATGGTITTGTSCGIASGDIVITDSTVIASGINKAMTDAPNISGCGITASTDKSGSPAVTYNAEDIAAYKYLKTTVLPKVDTPTTAVFTAADADSGALSGVTTDMKYSTDGMTWTDCSGDSMALTDLSACTLSVVNKGDNTTTADSLPQIISVTKAAMPAVGKTDCTTAGNDNGTLIGVTADMEWKKADGSWADGSGDDMTGLAPGTYYIRVKASGTCLASENQTVTISAYMGTPVAAPIISPAGGTFTEKVTVIILPGGSDPADTNLYYKLEGVANEYYRYIAPIDLTETVTVFAYAEKDGQQSGLVSAAFTKQSDTPHPSSGGSSNPTYTIVDSTAKTENGIIELHQKRAEEGDTVKLTVKADAGYALDTLTVRDSKGNELKITKNADSTYSFKMPAGKVTIEATFKAEETTWENPFTDVSENDWYYDGVAYAAENGLFNGTSADTFSPKADMTRQQMWMVLARVNGEALANMDEAAKWATENGISDGSNPTDAVTREQFVTLLWRCAGSPAASKDMSGYADFGSVADYAKEAMRWAVEDGIVVGTSATTLSPENTATRAQIAVILARYQQK